MEGVAVSGMIGIKTCAKMKQGIGCGFRRDLVFNLKTLLKNKLRNCVHWANSQIKGAKKPINSNPFFFHRIPSPDAILISYTTLCL